MDTPLKKEIYIASVLFAGRPKRYHFTTDKPDYKKGDHVVVSLKSGKLERAIFQSYITNNKTKPPCKIIGPA